MILQVAPLPHLPCHRSALLHSLTLPLHPHCWPTCSEPTKTGDQAAGASAPAKEPWRNPFLPPQPDLVVAPVGPGHTVVLNKFVVTPHHVLVITNEFQPQVVQMNKFKPQAVQTNVLQSELVQTHGFPP